MKNKRRWLLVVGFIIIATLIVIIIPKPVPVGLSPESACKPSFEAVTDDWGPDYCGGDWILEGITYSSPFRAQLTFNDGVNGGWCNISKIGPFWVMTNGGVTLVGCLQGF